MVPNSERSTLLLRANSENISINSLLIKIPPKYFKKKPAQLPYVFLQMNKI